MDVEAEAMDLLQRAFALGEQARGRVSPNPAVGCVITDADGQVVGEGWTQPPGGPHAEVVALGRAGDRARGGTAWVTLEPCSHHGRTPPCTTALIGGGIARVVHALSDPHPDGRGGTQVLRDAGVDVVADAAADQARDVHAVFLHTIAHARPYVVLKTATSLDGCIADHTGASQWITGPQTRLEGHRLRAWLEAVLVGSGTALADDPSLTCRLPDWDGPQPTRVVLDRRGRIDVDRLAMGRDDGGPVLVLDEPDPPAVLARLWDDGITSVLIEGGAGVAGAFVDAGLVDRYVLHLGNLLLGRGLASVDTALTLESSPRLRLVSVQASGDDVIVIAVPHDS